MGGREGGGDCFCRNLHIIKITLDQWSLTREDFSNYGFVMCVDSFVDLTSRGRGSGVISSKCSKWNLTEQFTTATTSHSKGKSGPKVNRAYVGKFFLSICHIYLFIYLSITYLLSIYHLSPII